jgi:hypothetical protein
MRPCEELSLSSELDVTAFLNRIKFGVRLVEDGPKPEK